MKNWRDRLRLAVDRTGEPHSVIARRAGIAPETLSRILTAQHAQPQFSTIVRIARAARVRVGWLVSEPVRGIELTDRDRATVCAAGVILFEAFRCGVGDASAATSAADAENLVENRP
jgi:transcriptional regulator with XRE-family HTH domain